ncbi:AraC-type DNA-binding protein [Lentzea waywayandensis]|uniref:AraC-type DNA-binding protein n=1 Tax=Lentzea waywayandensis TaxID=84724 RepID=A0A1I6F3F6_9PSEU|nr:helix-turn-helix domain-containing protein [Lentzea waywayandensis]SFR24461.1 AraC-type DNA-binding protein [Lentzea waywayandensis]
MAVLLDTATLPLRDRRDALITTMREASGTSRVELADDEPVRARVDLWPFGTASILRADSNGFANIGTTRSARSASGEHIAIGVHEMGVARYQVGAATRKVQAGEVLVVDVSRPFLFGWRGRGAALSLNTSAENLALPADLVTRAGSRLRSSPLYGLFSRHIMDITRNADLLSPGPAAGMLGAASIELARALIATAVDDVAGARDVVEQTLIVQIRAYVRQHLRDPDLGPGSIAAALAISPRHLHRVCTNANLSLEQWIITCRLDQAKAELVHPGSRHRSIGTISRRWGFKDQTHFTRRFRLAFGMLPSEWRRSAGF